MSTRWTKAPFVLALAIAGSVATAGPSRREPIRVETGRLAGTPGRDPSVTVFAGVPYAAPPIGERRWRAPEPAAPWDGVRSAERFAPNCIQRMRDALGPWTSEYQPKGEVSEDCLYLNVWTAAADGERRPVLVYVHGGAFTDGSGNVPVYDGEALARKGLVVVTINYRVGALGFFTHPELTRESGHAASGNYGLFDQVAALAWVKRNIAAFGGDPGRVTVAGQSAGAYSVHCLVASPLAKDLFQRAIAASGSNLHQGPGKTLAESEKEGVRFAESRGVRSLRELRLLSAETLAAPLAGGFSFGPIVDRWFLPETIDAALASGRTNDVPMLTGWTADEGSFDASYGRQTVAEFQDAVRRRTGALAEAFLAAYPASTQEEAAEAQKAAARDRSLVSTHLWAARRAERSQTAVFAYLFTHPQPGPTQGTYGVFHSSELLPYVFANLDRSDRPWTPLDRELAETLSGYWVSFAGTGDPNAPALPRWPAFSAADPRVMELGERMGPRPIAPPAKLDLLRRLLSGDGR